MVGVHGFDKHYIGCALSALTPNLFTEVTAHPAGKPVVQNRGTWAPLVAIALGSSPLINTIAYALIFVSVNIHPGIPPFTSCLQLKAQKPHKKGLNFIFWILNLGVP